MSGPTRLRKWSMVGTWWRQDDGSVAIACPHCGHAMSLGREGQAHQVGKTGDVSLTVKCAGCDAGLGQVHLDEYTPVST